MTRFDVEQDTNGATAIGGFLVIAASMEQCVGLGEDGATTYAGVVIVDHDGLQREWAPVPHTLVCIHEIHEVT